MIPGCDCGTCCDPCGHYPDCALTAASTWETPEPPACTIQDTDTPNC